MKTFEERYTAWIDGELEGNALVAFEQELERRAAVNDAYTDKADALKLTSFLHEHLHAPALTNADFFNHQLRERIAGERAAARRPQESASRAPLFAWSLSRLAWLGAASLFISGALYYGMIPKQGSAGVGGPVATNNQMSANAVQPAGPAVSTDQGNSGSNPSVAPGSRSTGNGPVEMVKLTKEQQEKIQRDRDLIEDQERLERQRAMIEPGADIQARVPDQTVPTTATPLHYKDSNVNVLWVNGLDYLPDASVIDGSAAAPAPAAPNPAPKVTATP